MRCTKGLLCITANSEDSNQFVSLQLEPSFCDCRFLGDQTGCVLMAKLLTRLHNLHSLLLFANAISTFVGDLSMSLFDHGY